MSSRRAASLRRSVFWLSLSPHRAWLPPPEPPRRPPRWGSDLPAAQPPPARPARGGAGPPCGAPAAGPTAAPADTRCKGTSQASADGGPGAYAYRTLDYPGASLTIFWGLADFGGLAGEYAIAGGQAHAMIY